MASSRWKRFAFFDCHTLNLPPQVLEDLIPSVSSTSDLTASGRRSTASLLNNSSKDVPQVSMVISTAALPTTTTTTTTTVAPSSGTKCSGNETSSSQQQQQQQDEDAEAGEAKQPIAAMLSSLTTACSTPQQQMVEDSTAAADNKIIRLPSQQQQSSQSRTTITSTTSSSSSTFNDGLILLWVASPKTRYVHCFDITLRASGMDNESDLDGWRGYFDAASSNRNSTTSNSEIAASGSEDNDHGGIVDLAICRRRRPQRPAGQTSATTATTTSAAQTYAPLHVACLTETNVFIQLDPHLNLSCRLPVATTSTSTNANNNTTTTVITLASPWNEGQYGRACTMDMNGNDGLLAVGTDTGHVLVFDYSSSSASNNGIVLYVTIPPPSMAPQGGGIVTSVQLGSTATSNDFNNKNDAKNSGSSSSIFCTYLKGNMGICCFEFSSNGITARHDLDSRHVASSSLTDYYTTLDSSSSGGSNSSNQGVGSGSGDYQRYLLVARPDGLYSYSKQQKIGVSPIDGTKNAICAVPPPTSTRKSSSRNKNNNGNKTNAALMGSAYALVASTDTKSGRDAVDIYDATNKLVAFHVLLSPGHKALRAVGLTTKRTRLSDGTTRGGRSTAVVITSGGSIVSLTEKVTSEKISLLVQKNLYAAAISMAYADPTFQPADITALYRRHAEHLYRKGDFNAAMDQYIYTIGSLESAHVIFRYLDAPKIPMLAKYLEELRSRDMATPVHNELLRTCYLKLNDNEAAEKIAASASRTTDTASCSSLVSSLAHNPKEALATICTFEAPQAAEALVVHGAALARALPRETAGVVVSLCVGTYSPTALAEASSEQAANMLDVGDDNRPRICTPYPFHLFASSFVESPKVLRLLLAHCNRNKCPLTPSLRRTLLELTLSEWNDAKRTGDTEAEKLRRKEAITALTDAHCRDIGDYDALVIVQLAGFSEGELLLYERLQMTPMLLARYAQDGGDRARRHMLAMCRTDPEVLADVLGHFVTIASERIHHNDDASMNSEEEEILDDIREALALARAQGALPPVRIARILAGEGAGQFSNDTRRDEKEKESSHQTVPLSVALDYVGAILDDSRQEISRLKAEVEEYNQLCNSMEAEVNSLLSGSQTPGESGKPSSSSRMNIEDLHSKLKSALEEGSRSENSSSAQSREAFWREINQSEDRYDTIARFFAKGIIQ